MSNFERGWASGFKSVHERKRREQATFDELWNHITELLKKRSIAYDELFERRHELTKSEYKYLNDLVNKLDDEIIALDDILQGK